MWVLRLSLPCFRLRLCLFPFELSLTLKVGVKCFEMLRQMRGASYAINSNGMFFVPRLLCDAVSVAVPAGTGQLRKTNSYGR